ncbi:MAG: hydrogenase membrane subunit [Candidatus Aenigmarchaeota archaeon]|nr:hydrogenase membrane subunit [Candidatus Aenigmarchaeota archaeon]
MTILLYAVTTALALAVAALSKSQKLMHWTSIAHAMAYLLISVYTIIYAVIPTFYMDNRYLFIDHLGIYEVLIASVVFLLAAIYAGGYADCLISAKELDRKNLKLFYLSFNALLALTSMAFFSNNLGLFWILAELTTIFSAILVAILNAKDNIDAALKYIFTTSTSMLFSFIGLILLFALTQGVAGTGTLNWDALMAMANALSPGILAAAFVFTFIGFGAKSGIVPFHTWLPHAHAKAPSVISAILSAALLNVGIYGIIRMFAITRAASASYVLIFFGLLSVAIAALSMLQQKNTKKLIAFSSIEQMGMILIAIGIGTAASVFWALALIFAHALTKSLLFFSAGALHRQYGSNRIDDIWDVFRLQPLAATGMILGIAGIIGAPPFALFVPKLFVLAAIGSFSTLLLFAVLAFLLVAVAAFTVFLTCMVSQSDAEKIRAVQIPVGMKIPIIMLIALIIIGGIFFPAELHAMLTSIVVELGL